jgi:hypothetical protein
MYHIRGVSVKLPLARSAIDATAVADLVFTARPVYLPKEVILETPFVTLHHPAEN